MSPPQRASTGTRLTRQSLPVLVRQEVKEVEVLEEEGSVGSGPLSGLK
jgi:hypothetical protein